MLKNYFVFENAESKTADRTIIEKKAFISFDRFLKN